MRARLLAAAAVATASVTLGLAVHAGDAPEGGGHPPPQSAIDHPLLNAMVGDWTVTWSSTMPAPTTGKATSKVTKAIGGTALVEDYSSDMMGGFHGHGVTKVSEDGKTLTIWWFDSMGSEPIVLKGPLEAGQAITE